MVDLAFRRAILSDAEAIVALVNSAYRGESSTAGWTTEASLLGGQRTDTAEITALITTPDALVLLCLDGAEIVGSVHLEKAAHSAYIGMFTVKPTLQGRGIGKSFLSFAEETAAQVWGIQTLTMTVLTLRHELIAFYERRGYRRTGKIKPFPTDPKFGIPKVAGLQLEVLEKQR
jgi:ribosomal protein S18 acetylase RimI-like enzyme